jgi:hypothetical protein
LILANSTTSLSHDYSRRFYERVKAGPKEEGREASGRERFIKRFKEYFCFCHEQCCKKQCRKTDQRYRDCGDRGPGY